jgi:hypothetical protein
MTPRVRRDGGVVRKALADAMSAGPGARLARRSELLAARGIRTPQARYDASARELVLPWIRGTPGREILRRADGRLSTSHLIACLLPLVRLHGTDPAGFDLRPLDPWRRIDPRLLELQAAAGSAEARALCRAAQRARGSTERRLVAISAQRDGAGQVLVHGDYHIGQLVFASSLGEPWLLDLDDLALAAPESDLGNFAAHLATVEGCAGDTLDIFRGLTSLLCPLYEGLAQHRVEPNPVEAYGAVALLRRALKLRERGASMAAVLDILSAAERLASAGTAASPNPGGRRPGDRDGRLLMGGRKTAEA